MPIWIITQVQCTLADCICVFTKKPFFPVRAEKNSKVEKGNGFTKYEVREVKGIQFSAPLVKIALKKQQKHHVNSIMPTSALSRAGEGAH